MAKIPAKYAKDPELAKWWLFVESIANGKCDEPFLGEAASVRADGSFDGSIMPDWVRNTFLEDGYIVPAQPKGWYRKA